MVVLVVIIALLIFVYKRMAPLEMPPPAEKVAVDCARLGDGALAMLDDTSSADEVEKKTRAFA